jgi:chorismate mutase
MGLSLIWSFISSKLGIIVIAALALGVFGTYHKLTVWWNESNIAKIEKERDKALLDLYQERQKVADLEATIKFQRNQLSLRQKVQKETSDVKKAVSDNNRDYLYDNWNRVYNYKVPPSPTKDTGSNIKRPNAKAKAKTAE